MATQWDEVSNQQQKFVWVAHIFYVELENGLTENTLTCSSQ